jgi:TRAP-type uncharacterized transport system substrate-binding protein
MRAIWSARSLRIFGFSFALIATLGIWRAGAQQRDPRIEPNVGTVGIISGSPGGTYIYMATDLSFVHDDLMKYTLRVIPMVGRGSVQNIDELLVLKRMSNGHPMSRLDDLLPWNLRPITTLN